MILLPLDSSHRDESNECKIIPIGAIFAKLAIFAKFQIGSGWVKLSDPTRYFGSVRVGYPDHGSKFGALVFIESEPFSWLSIGSLKLTNSAFIALYTDITVSLGTVLTNDSTIVFKTNWKTSLIIRFLSSWGFFISGFFLLDASFFFLNHNIYESRYQNYH